MAPDFYQEFAIVVVVVVVAIMLAVMMVLTEIVDV